ncbi:MAG: polyphosphate kinase 2 [Verrucomicrobiales bacterium]|jgi:polyphosphate kinase 2 (PPK2 family)|nr:polyphosphate kinase 2 [Verrucomicrobiales bacterium]
MGVLNELDLTKQIEEKSTYRKKLEQLQLDLLHLQPRLRQTKRSLILVFEGPDAAGKGGVIKRTLERLDPRAVRVYSIVKPTAQEYAHHYLRRFWIKLPNYGEIAVFDRSWYGRVLVERVEGFAARAEWKRAYEEINHFEKTLADDGAILLKFYLHITKDEQLARFKKRAADPYKRWKINAEDWRNREKWHQHNEAAEEMFAKCGPARAPWILVEGNYKWHARLKVLRAVVKRLEKEIGKI